MERRAKALKLGQEFIKIMYSGKVGYLVEITTNRKMYWSDANNSYSRDFFNLRIKFVDVCRKLGVDKEQGILLEVADPRTMVFNLCKVYDRIRDRVDFPNPFEPLKQLYKINYVPIGVVRHKFVIKLR